MSSRIHVGHRAKQTEPGVDQLIASGLAPALEDKIAKVEIPGWMRGRLNGPVRAFGCFVLAVSTRVQRLGRDNLDVGGPVLLACNHLCHNDPLLLAILTPRRVDWMARIEFLRSRWTTWMLQLFDAFTVDRFGNALPGLREGLRRLERGRTVGMFPEGGVMSGSDSVLGGGSVKQGVFWLAQRSGAPVVPCVMLGSRAYLRVVPWLPLKAGRLWVSYGDPIYPRTARDSSPGERKADRQVMALRYQREMVALYEGLLGRFPDAKPHE